LADTSAGRGAWYWIEVMKNNPGGTGGLLTNASSTGSVNAKLIYRITAIARGLKPASQVVFANHRSFSRHCWRMNLSSSVREQTMPKKHPRHIRRTALSLLIGGMGMHHGTMAGIFKSGAISCGVCGEGACTQRHRFGG